MTDRHHRPERRTRVVRSQNFSQPSIPGTSGFVPVRMILDPLSHILASALHRDAHGNPRAGLSCRLLAAALHNGDVAVDPLILRWTPPATDAAVILHGAWGSATRHEGEHHRHLRAAAVGLLTAWFPAAVVEAERPRSGPSRNVRPDLQVRTDGSEVILAEVGAVEGDAIAAMLMPGPKIQNNAEATRVTHIVVLPFPGRYAASARGYAFRLADTPALTSPSPAALRKGWRTFSARFAALPGAF